MLPPSLFVRGSDAAHVLSSLAVITSGLPPSSVPVLYAQYRQAHYPQFLYSASSVCAGINNNALSNAGFAEDNAQCNCGFRSVQLWFRSVQAQFPLSTVSAVSTVLGKSRRNQSLQAFRTSWCEPSVLILRRTQQNHHLPATARYCSPPTCATASSF